MTARITRRQTTFWELADSSGEFRFHFAHKQEQHFVSPECDQFGVVTDHPVLIDYSQPWSSIYVASPATDPTQILERIASQVAVVVGPWRRSNDYLNRQADPSSLLQKGAGLLLRAPNAIVALVHPILGAAGVKFTVLPHLPSRWPMQSFVAGRNFVVAREFHVQRGSNNSFEADGYAAAQFKR
ncbi:hypothetical protein ACFPME_11735 [Rhodanobacter umsongensis]|uniref:Uncharacterized protein n=1 Tax=Rhodanobacter umsongensis TaxID=633153 RepID=A0ABW0JN34_9GAMM